MGVLVVVVKSHATGWKCSVICFILALCVFWLLDVHPLNILVKDHQREEWLEVQIC